MEDLDRRPPHATLRPWSVVLGLLVLHLALALRLRGPVLFGDETSYLAIARALAGLEPRQALGATTMEFVSFYHPGVALFLAPVYALGASPRVAYLWSLGLNAVLATVCFPLLYALLRRAWRVDLGLATTWALAAATYPSLLILSKLCWPETALAAVSIALVTRLYTLFERPTPACAAALASLALAAYALHPRALSYLPVVVGAIALLAWRRRLSPTGAALALAILGFGFAGLHLFNGWLRSTLWSGLTAADAASLVSRLGDPTALTVVPTSLFGEAWYLCAASLGAAPLGLAWLTREALGDPGPRRDGARFTLALAVALLGTAALVNIEHDRADKIVYGRYIECLMPVWIAAAGAAVTHWRMRLKHTLAAVLLFVAGAWLVIVSNVPEAFSGAMNPLNVVALQSPMLMLGGLRILRLSAVAIAAGAVLLVMAKRSRVSAGVGLAVVFLGGSMHTYWAWFDALSLAIADSTRLPQAFEAAGGGGHVAYDIDVLTLQGFYAYPFYLDRVRFDLVQNSVPTGPFVIARRAAPLLQDQGARLVFPERRIDQGLWVLPGPELDALRARGFLVAENANATLPAAAGRQSIRVVGSPPSVLPPGGHATVELEITHAGEAAIWLPTAAGFDEQTSVFVKALWFDSDGASVAEQEADLPYAVWPGATVPIRLVLTAKDFQGRDLPAGSYRLRLGAGQRARPWFDDASGPSSLTLAVR